MKRRVITTKRQTTKKPIPTTKKVVKVSSIRLSTGFSVYVGQSRKIQVSSSPNNAQNKRVKWSSTNSNVVSVNSNGVDYAKKNGSATIYCKATDGSGCVGSCSVTVKSKNVSVSVIRLNLNKATLGVKDTVKLNATIIPSNATNKSLSWSSSNTSIATVNSKGVVYAKKNGSTTIFCKARDGSGRMAQCIITVK